MRPPRPNPCWRRHSSRLTRSTDTGTPAGNPVKVATRHCPWDSPAVSKRSMYGLVLSYRTRLLAGNGDSSFAQHTLMTSVALIRAPPQTYREGFQFWNTNKNLDNSTGFAKSLP